MISLIKDWDGSNLNLMSKNGMKIENLTPIELSKSSIASCLSSYIDEENCQKLSCSTYPIIISVTFSNKRIIIQCSKDDKEFIENICLKCNILKIINLQYEVKIEGK